MKNKLRKITIEQVKYLYITSTTFHATTQNNTLRVRIFLSGQKKTPLIVEFLTPDHYYSGQLLNTGIELFNTKKNITERININEPKSIRELILKGIEKGWTGTNKMAIQDGIVYLHELGYETSMLNPNQ